MLSAPAALVQVSGYVVATHAYVMQVLVVSIGKNLQPKRMEICAQLWAKQIRAEFGYKATSNLKEALAYADDNGIPYVVLFGESELASQSVKVRRRCSAD